jgi:D-amino-acid dehydrogenase
LFEQRGGRFVRADARLVGQEADGRWVLPAEGEKLEARDVVVALGPWSDDLFRPLGLRLPFAVKRGYHMHYRPLDGAALNRPVVDTFNGYVMTDQARGIRVTTGAEFARRDAPPTPVQLAKAEPAARTLLSLGERLDPKPWLGARPFLPDLIPAIGPVPGRKGLWLNFGHHHLGFTSGPTSGRLLAAMMTGGEVPADPAPYRVDRFK